VVIVLSFRHDKTSTGIARNKSFFINRL